MASRPRREPPAFRRATVESITALTPRMFSLRVRGTELEGFTVDEPAASIRLLVPDPGQRELTLPEWNGNEFLTATGDRPALRTFTPLEVDPDAGALTVQIVRHGDGAVSGWAEQASPGDPVAISGPGRGHTIDPDATRHVLLGDETAIPAIGQLLDAIDDSATVDVHVEVTHDDATMALPRHPGAQVSWTTNRSGEPGVTLLASMRATDVDEHTAVWAAGEAAAVQAIRRHLFDERGLPRSAATVRGYWKRR